MIFTESSEATYYTGISIEKVDALREPFEETGYSLTDSPHLRELISFILEQETCKLKEISGKHLSIIFDGTTHVCEALFVTGMIGRLNSEYVD